MVPWPWCAIGAAPHGSSSRQVTDEIADVLIEAPGPVPRRRRRGAMGMAPRRRCLPAFPAEIAAETLVLVGHLARSWSAELHAQAY